MYYCETCRTKNDWPHAVARSHGRCEVCGQIAVCYDRPSNLLPRPPFVPKRASDFVNFVETGWTLPDYPETFRFRRSANALRYVYYRLLKFPHETARTQLLEDVRSRDLTVSPELARINAILEARHNYGDYS